jgi:uncharacterized membrane protein
MTAVAPSTASGAPVVRRITAEDLQIALKQGFDDFSAKRGEILMLALIYPVVGLLTCVAAFNGNLVALAFPLAAGLSLMGPAVAAGFYEIARMREAGDASAWSHFLDAWRGRSGVALAILTGGLLVLFMAWVGVAWAIYAATVGETPYAGLGDFVRRVVSTPQGWAMIGLGNLAGLVFAAVALAASAVSFPMVVDRDVDPLTAVRTSVAAVTQSPAVFARWGLTVAVLLVLGAIPLFVGLAVVLPVLGYATWHLYTRAVVRPVR